MHRIFSIFAAFLAFIFPGHRVVTTTAPLPPVAVEALPSSTPQLESFIKQSAAEVADPQKGRSTSGTQHAAASTISLASGCISENFDCWEKFYRSIVQKDGVPAAFADLRARYDKDAFIRSLCHPLAHVIGRAATEKYSDVSEAYFHGDSFCWSGYYHGVLEGIAGKMGDQKFYSSLNDICANIPGKENYAFDYYNCVHGLGHGLMEVTQDELFKSLNFCDRLNGWWEQSSCASGVFMENIIVDNKNHFTKYLKPSEPLYPCTDAPDKYKSQCFLMQTSYMLKVTNSNFKKVFALCATAPDAYQNTCYQSLGRDAAGRSADTVPSTKFNCDLGSNLEQRSNCIVGAVKDFISYYHSDAQAKQLCASLDPSLREVCITTAAEYYKTF